MQIHPTLFINQSDRIMHGLRVMLGTLRPRKDDLRLPEIQKTPKGNEYHIYYPSGKARRTVILIYGMTLEGENDGRLLRFARSCADAGLRVIVPHLPGLMGFHVARGDMRRLVDIVSSLSLDNGPKIGLIGFSTGGSYSLLLAARPKLRDKIGPVVLFSPIYDARDVAERLHAPVNPAPQTPKAWDEFYWAQFVIAFRNRKRLGLAAAVQEALQVFLSDYGDYDLAVKRVFYEKYIAWYQLTDRDDLVNEGSALDQLSARGQLAEVKSPVFILHDASDQIVPPQHSRSMYEELALRGTEFQQEVLVTPWVSHVILQNNGKLSELARIVSFTAELFR